MKYRITKLSNIDIDVIDGDRGSNYPHQDELFNSGFCLFLSAKNVTQNGFEFTDNQFITKEKDESLNNGKLNRGDIVITTRGTIGNLAIYSSNIKYNNIRINSGMLIIRCNKSIDNYYLYQVLRTRWFYEQILSTQSGSAQPQLPKSHFLKMSIPLPPLPIQRKIAAVLTALDDKIALNKRINDKLEAMAKRLYDYWFVQFDFPDENGRPYKSSGGKMVWNETLKREIPEGWEVKSIKEIIEPIQKGISYTSEDINTLNGIPMINLGCYDKQGEYRVNELKVFSGNYSSEDLVYPFEMLIACTDMTQNCDIIGRPIFVTREHPFYIYTMDLAKISSNSCFKMYLYYTLRTNFYHKYIKPFASGTNVKHLNVSGIENYVIQIPSVNIISNFENLVISFKEKQMFYINEISRLTSLRDRLLPLLMNGQVVVEGKF